MKGCFKRAGAKQLVVVCLASILVACGSSSNNELTEPPVTQPPVVEPPISEPPVVEPPEVITVPFDNARAGKVDGVRIWQLPDAPSGSRPDQSWLALGSDSEGAIYISGHDHHSNSMLYRLFQADQTLRWVGDARSASEAANNWQDGETAEKFHTRPTAHQGRVYVATLDKSSMDTSYLNTRGFHWYGYDNQDQRFIDLSATEANGVGAATMQVVTIQVDTENDLLYGMSIPENRLLKYDIGKGVTTVLGRPQQWNGYFYSNRFMWLDSRGRVYISGGSERSQWNRGEDPEIFNHVWYYDPLSGFGELPAFALQGANALEVGQWDRTHQRLYTSDDQGNIYVFTDATASWAYLGRPSFSNAAKTWIFQLSADEQKIYIGLSDMGAENNALFEYEIATGESTVLVNIDELDDQAAAENFIAGYDSWDKQGNFYIAAFSMYDGENVLMLGINPVRIKVAKGILPELLEVSAVVEGENIIVSRSGDNSLPLSVLYEVKGLDLNESLMFSEFGQFTFPATQSRQMISLDSLQLPVEEGYTSTVFELVPDGNSYISNHQQVLLNP
ncbi:hypothetical protein M0C34_04510 [Agarivorans sp. TSD2052]|uniref:hypothetical protein n=1 Tax=Agarivorans sp. TSD2052 TaxID=2937286 RepID=UPI00200FA8EB|nr:hypothetical protein [Agarivorans sp. TSD2052]UPW19546.1 hypothetical protein M0C34_04510 [Agarivorans sp. TSD2052]